MEDDAFSQSAIWEEFTKAGFSSKDFGRENIFSYPLIDSTNTELLRRIEKDGPSKEKILVAAEEQSAGRGRVKRTFYSPKKSGVYFSIALVPETEDFNPAIYTASAAVAICRAVEALCRTKTQIKWVNDIFINGKKISGILAEGHVSPATGKIDALVIGIGINISSEGLPAALRASAAGITDGSEASFTRAKLVAYCTGQLLRILDTKEDIIEEYRRRSMLIGSTVTVTPLAGSTRSSYSATVTGISGSAGLLVKKSDGTEAELHSGEVTLHNG